MTQRLALGITVGSANSVAVVATRDGEPGIDSELVLTHPTVLRISAGEQAIFGAEAAAGGRHAPGARIEGFLARVGDPVAMLADDGTSHSASSLVATAIARLAEEAADSDATVVACHPAHWSPHTVAMLRSALDDVALPEVTLIPEPVAAVRWSRATSRPTPDDGAVLVYDLGATGLTVSLVRTGERIELLGTPVHTTEISGSEFDLLTMRYVLANAPDGIDADPFDPIVERELAALRERCRIAKEELSTRTATVVTMRSNPDEPQGSTIRLVRDDVEDLLRDPLRGSLASISDAVHRAGIDIGDISRVLLTGGGGSIPLLTELISTEFGLPVVSAPEPAHTSALGASALASDLPDAADTTPITSLTLAGPPETEPTRTGRPAAPLPLPTAAHRPGAARNRRRRVAVIAAAAAAIGLLATGTVAVSTGAGTRTEHPAAPEHTTSTTAGTADTAGGSITPGGAPAGTIADPSAPLPKDGARQSDPTAPGAITVLNSQPGATARPGDHTTPTPAVQGASPAPAPNNGQAPQPAPPSPAPQSPPPAPQSPPPAPQSPPPAPQQPPAQSPNLPTDGLTDTLGDTVGTVGGAVGTVLRAPGEILGGSGG
ncbi:Hsp70 family protein [Nocardia sp. NPDC059180]|uniref:Hsp70 family protein n=1 Tax=Nocardia sp. NPDC059180 TaxID=3346761 RepID=UPI003690CD51